MSKVYVITAFYKKNGRLEMIAERDNTAAGIIQDFFRELRTGKIVRIDITYEDDQDKLND